MVHAFVVKKFFSETMELFARELDREAP